MDRNTIEKGRGSCYSKRKAASAILCPENGILYRKTPNLTVYRKYHQKTSKEILLKSKKQDIGRIVEIAGTIKIYSCSFFCCGRYPKKRKEDIDGTK